MVPKNFVFTANRTLDGKDSLWTVMVIGEHRTLTIRFEHNKKQYTFLIGPEAVIRKLITAYIRDTEDKSGDYGTLIDITSSEGGLDDIVLNTTPEKINLFAVAVSRHVHACLDAITAAHRCRIHAYAESRLLGLISETYHGMIERIVCTNIRLTMFNSEPASFEPVVWKYD